MKLSQKLLELGFSLLEGQKSESFTFEYCNGTLGVADEDGYVWTRESHGRVDYFVEELRTFNLKRSMAAV